MIKNWFEGKRFLHTTDSWVSNLDPLFPFRFSFYIVALSICQSSISFLCLFSRYFVSFQCYSFFSMSLLIRIWLPLTFYHWAFRILSHCMSCVFSFLKASDFSSFPTLATKQVPYIKAQKKRIAWSQFLLKWFFVEMIALFIPAFLVQMDVQTNMDTKKSR